MLRMWWARWSIWIVGCAVATAVVIGNAFYQKKQFYPAVVFITKSKPSMAVMYAQALLFVVMLGKLFRKLFFGQLRAAEFEHLVERSWYAVTETCLAFTVFKDDFSPKFLALFTLLLFLKSFHWLAEERVDYMERSPVITWVFHIRILSLLSILVLLDLYFVNLAYLSTITKGPSVQLVFGFEYAILTTVLFNTLAKYVFHVIDMQNETPWENKAVFVLYTDVVIGFCKVALYVIFVAIMVRTYTLPLFALRPTYLALRAFKKAVNDVIMSRRAINNMNNLYPDVTQEELANTDNVCIICREEMTGGAKKLPCNHIFHVSCLRSWFQRQQTCPTCRLNVLRVPPPAPAAGAGPAPGPQAQGAANVPPPMNQFFGFGVRPPQPQPQQQQAQQIPPFGMGMGMFGGIPQWPPAQAVPQQGAAPPPQPPAGETPGNTNDAQPGASGTQQPQAGGDASAAAGGNQNGARSQFPFMFGTVPPPFMFRPPGGSPTATGAGTNGSSYPFGMPPMPYIPLVPPPPPLLQTTGLSDEELRRMEGTARENLEARLRCLRNVQILLDSAVVQMQQYSAVVANITSTTDNSATPTAGPSPNASASASTSSSSSVPKSPSSADAESKVTMTTAPSSSSTSFSASPDAVSPATPKVNGVLEGELRTSLSGEASSSSSSSTTANNVEQDELRKRRLQRFGNHTDTEAANNVGE